MINQLKRKVDFIKFVLWLIVVAGLYLTLAWASYSPLDNGWSVASSMTHGVLNKAGSLGAWVIDILFAAWGRVTFMLPLACIGVPLYLLIMQQTARLRLLHLVGWSLSFLLFMAGLAGLASAMLPNSAAYLAGGFIGAWQIDWIGQHLSVFGALICTMIFTIMGFTLCSGRILVQLAGHFYDWLMAKELPAKPKAAEQAVDIEAEIAEFDEVETTEPLNTEQENSPLASQLTDVSIFARPKITGLRNQPAQPEQTEAFTDVTQFTPKADDSLPQVSVPEAAWSSQIATHSEPTQIAPEVPLSDTLRIPQVRLQPEVPSVQPETEKIALNEPPVAAVPSSSLPSSSPNMQPPQEEASPAFLKPNTKIVLPEPVETVAPQAETSTQNVATPYPKGYGDSLVHPLLQRKISVEKPTTPLPTLDLLTEAKQEVQQITEQEIRATSLRIEQELANFGVKATVEDVLVGPVVTRYEIKPAAGVKASKIMNLASDLARALIFKAIRITDVVEGKPFMGIETPNKQRETVWLRDVLDSDAFRYSKATLPMALGKSINGDPVVVDMAKMPHLLVAGQTGGGKSVGVNTMILSLLFKLSPDQVRFIMIDPKVVELSVYNDIPHLLTPVVTDMKKAENALRWAVEEMERRYLLVSSLGVRNIEGFNSKIDQAAAMDLPIPNPLWRPGDTMDTLPPPLEKLTYIVLIVDEFADLMMSAGKQVEDHIMRIAQKARAVGIHLILATQRPSTDVITGVIKANIPSRIAFTVASQIDSRTILDKGGAESLLGRGDMLYSGASNPEIIRVHGAFMSDDDVVRVADNWRARGKPNYIDSIIESADEGDVDGGDRSAGGDLDPLFDEISQYMIDSGVTSISGIQRRFSLGFNRAARIIDQLEEQGIVSAPDSRGKREVLAR